MGLARRLWAPGPQARVDWSHPAAARLTMCFLTGPGVDLVAGRPMTRLAGGASTVPVPRDHPYGRGAYHAASGGASGWSGPAVDLFGAGSSSTQGSMTFLVRWISTLSNQAYLADTETSRIALYPGDAGSNYGLYAGNNLLTASGVRALHRWDTVTFNWSDVADYRSIALNGRIVAESTASWTYGPATMGPNLFLFSRITGNEGEASYSVLALAHSAPLPLTTHQAIAADPFCMLHGGS